VSVHSIRRWKKRCGVYWRLIGFFVCNVFLYRAVRYNNIIIGQRWIILRNNIIDPRSSFDLKTSHALFSSPAVDLQAAEDIFSWYVILFNNILLLLLLFRHFWGHVPHSQTRYNKGRAGVPRFSEFKSVRITLLLTLIIHNNNIWNTSLSTCAYLVVAFYLDAIDEFFFFPWFFDSVFFFDLSHQIFKI
jgi:hypothetical protein